MLCLSSFSVPFLLPTSAVLVKPTIMTFLSRSLLAFVWMSRTSGFAPSTTTARSPLMAASTSASLSRLHQSTDDSGTQLVVDQLLKLVEDPVQDQNQIRQIVSELAKKEDESASSKSLSSSTNDDIFTPLLGNYNVSCTLPCAPTERPVGGKWNSNPALFRVQQTWQHLLPVAKQAVDDSSVAQVVNMIVVKMFFVISLYVILRGNAYALSTSKRQEIQQERQTPGGLSPRTVRADFDPPRIVICLRRQQPWFALSLGPKSSVVLDTPYCDDRIRIGKGSKGSQFVFVRSTDKDADRWDPMLKVKPIGKFALTSLLGSISAILWWSQMRLVSGLAARVLLAPLTAMTSLSTVMVAISTGGIERDSSSATDVREQENT